MNLEFHKGSAGFVPRLLTKGHQCNHRNICTRHLKRNTVVSPTIFSMTSLMRIKTESIVINQTSKGRVCRAITNRIERSKTLSRSPPSETLWWHRSGNARGAYFNTFWNGTPWWEIQGAARCSQMNWASNSHRTRRQVVRRCCFGTRQCAPSRGNARHPQFQQQNLEALAYPITEHTSSISLHLSRTHRNLINLKMMATWQMGCMTSLIIIFF